MRPVVCAAQVHALGRGACLSVTESASTWHEKCLCAHARESGGLGPEPVLGVTVLGRVLCDQAYVYEYENE